MPIGSEFQMLGAAALNAHLAVLSEYVSLEQTGTEHQRTSVTLQQFIKVWQEELSTKPCM